MVQAMCFVSCVVGEGQEDVSGEMGILQLFYTTAGCAATGGSIKVKVEGGNHEK